MTQQITLACLAVMGAAILFAYPLSMIGWELAAGAVFIIAMIAAWIAAAAAFVAKLER